jgi:small-conductance mechanosensitive channel
MMQSLSGLLRGLITNDQPENYEEVATDWLLALFVVAFIWMAVMLVVELYRKWRQVHAEGRLWGTVRILVWMLLGLAPVLVTVLVVYYYSLDFQTVVGTPGLFKGIVVGWFLYVLMFLFGHLFGDLRRDLFHR